MYVPPQHDRNVEMETTAASFVATFTVLAVMPSIPTNELTCKARESGSLVGAASFG